MAEIYRVGGISQAFELASNFQQEGRYDWFRGQSRMWPLKSTIARETEDESSLSMHKLQRFLDWAKTYGELSYLTENIDNLIAVAQHYGLSTNFIDFTTDPAVAAYFAGSVPENEIYESCIICLDTKDFSNFSYFEHLSRAKPLNGIVPKTLTLSVPNLWRLEAQSGAFLVSPYENLEDIYDMDRIVFPATGVWEGKLESDIYPERKSNLELLLDSYFMVEQLRTTSEIINAGEGFKKYHIKPEEFHCNPDIVDSDVPFHASWIESEKAKKWSEFSIETYCDVMGGDDVKIYITEDNEFKDNDFIKSIILKMIDSKTLSRNKIHNFSITFPSEYREISEKISKKINVLWDGLRSSPCSDEEIAKAIENLIQLSISIEPQQYKENMLQVEFGYSDGSYSRAYVHINNLLNAVREDVCEYIRPEKRVNMESNVRGLLQAIYSPQRLFCFEPFARIFVEEIVPYQVLSRPNTLYSPIKIDSFGLP